MDGAVAGPAKTVLESAGAAVVDKEKKRLDAMPPELPMPDDPGSVKSKTRMRKKTVKSAKRGRMSTILSGSLG